MSFLNEEEIDQQKTVKLARQNVLSGLNVKLEPGEEPRTYTLTSADASFITSFPLSTIRHILIRPTDVEGADIEIASMRLVTLKEHLTSIPSGIGWPCLSPSTRNETALSASGARR